MNINTYFGKNDNINKGLSSSLKLGPFYDETVADFYNNCIQNELTNISTRIKDWDKMLKKYVKLETPIFWIRKYESVGDKDSSNKQNNRRGGLTLVVDADDNIKFAYAFISNYDAQEFYNMVRGKVDAPAEKDFNDMMWKGNFQFHYDPKGGDCQDDKIAYFENRGNVKSGILNQQYWYLAHVIDVNDIVYENSFSLSNSDIDRIFFPRGDVSDWNLVSKCSVEIQKQLNTDKISNGLDRKVRIIKISSIYDNFRKFSDETSVAKDSDIDDFFKKLLIAHFLRFVHPLNYFLVPSKKCEVNGIFGRKNVSIGECKSLVIYVKNKMEDMSAFKTMLNELHKDIMIPAVSSGGSALGKTKIYISYGTKYINYIFLDDGITVSVPSRYTDFEDFLKDFNKKAGSRFLKVKYIIKRETYELLFNPRLEVSQQKLKERIKKDMRAHGVTAEIKDLEYVAVDMELASLPSAKTKSKTPIMSATGKAKKTKVKTSIPLSKGKTAYSFNGTKYIKARDVVLAVIQLYLKNNQESTFTELTDAFKSTRIVKKSSDISDADKGIGANSNGKRNTERYFVNDEITLADGNKVMVSNQWTGNGGPNDNLHPFIINAKKLGYIIQEEKE